MNSHTWNEISNQHEALRQTLVVMEGFHLPSVSADEIHIFTGCGTSYYLAHSAAKYYQKTTGKTAIAVQSSEILIEEDSVFAKGCSYRLVAISRSGTTTEVVKALEHVKNRQDIKTVAITCNKDSKTAVLSDRSIVLDFIDEKSVVMTQSFSCMLFALQLYAAFSTDDLTKKNFLKGLPELSKEVMKEKEMLKSLAQNKKLGRYIFLGAGAFHGLAKEATLKLKEMTQTECESYSTLEFRHGPISIVDETTVVVLLSSENSEYYDKSVVSDIQNKGGTVVVMTKDDSSLTGDFTVRLPTSMPSDEMLVACMPHLQLLAFYKALDLGLDPDRPRNLTQVVRLNI
ncbi:SIS domain-containing protein [Sutcliffiella sp. NPDC057660]|uniref:SIS domain-containing protein n=1 Tax=Sutcliffiella sp. NPDC057660 TaxID=3346199 RepID=UPI00368423EC